MDPLCGWTFASTSVIMKAVESRGRDEVIATLQGAFAGAPPATHPYHALVELVRRQGPCLLVNMRRGRDGNHPQHNMTLAIFRQIKGAAAAKGLAVVRVGTYQDESNTPGASWMDDLDTTEDRVVVDLFTPGERANRSYTAWLWLQMSKLPGVSGVIGGRSGSLDVAAFMGNRVLCWDIPDVSDHEYARLFLAFSIMSIARRERCLTKKGTDPGGLLAEIDLALWLDGVEVIPDHGGALPAFSGTFLALAPTLSQLTGMRPVRHPHEAERVMLEPRVLLACGAVRDVQGGSDALPGLQSLKAGREEVGGGGARGG